MRKLSLILVIAVLVLITICLLFKIWDSDGSGKDISYTQFLQIAKPSVLQYCVNLNNIAGNSANEGKKCPTCFPMISANYDNYYSQFPESYALVKRGGSYTLSMEVKTIYGLRNDMPGSTSLYFVIDESGNITEKNLPAVPCI